MNKQSNLVMNDEIVAFAKKLKIIIGEHPKLFRCYGRKMFSLSPHGHITISPKSGFRHCELTKPEDEFEITVIPRSSHINV